MSKINTIDKLQSRIQRDISWRKKECVDMFSINSLQTEYEQKLSIKASVVLLYSHWEGFVKKSSEFYLDFLSCQNLKYEDLNEKFIIHYISQKYRDTSMKFTRSLIYSIYFEDSLGHAENIFKVDGYAEISKFSNINSERLFNLFRVLCIDEKDPTVEYFNLKSKFLDETILGKRNLIAHGTYTLIDFDMYENIHEVILEMLDKYSSLILDIAENKSYLKSVSNI